MLGRRELPTNDKRSFELARSVGYQEPPRSGWNRNGCLNSSLLALLVRFWKGVGAKISVLPANRAFSWVRTEFWHATRVQSLRGAA